MTGPNPAEIRKTGSCRSVRLGATDPREKLTAWAERVVGLSQLIHPCHVRQSEYPNRASGIIFEDGAMWLKPGAMNSDRNPYKQAESLAFPFARFDETRVRREPNS